MLIWYRIIILKTSVEHGLCEKPGCERQNTFDDSGLSPCLRSSQGEAMLLT